MKSSEKKLNIRVPENIQSLVPYPPGKPIEELERELGLSGSIKLASNESPIGPSKKAIEAIKGVLSGLNRYPDGSGYYLKRALAGRMGGLLPEQVILGNGSNEIIELLIRTFVGGGEEVLTGDPSFAVYPIITQASGGKWVGVPLKDFTLDLDAMAKAVTEKTRLVIIANPNNPTGTAVGEKALRAFIESVPDDVIVAIDEAYIEYVKMSGFPMSLEYVREGRPVVVMRTFSKIFGLAGLRIGYGVAHAELIDYMDRVRQPFNVSTVAQSAALAALDDTEHLAKARRVNDEGLKYLTGAIDAMGLTQLPTEANFFVIKVGDGKGVYEALLKKGVIVRPMDAFGLGEYIRVNVGITEENQRFITALGEVLSPGAAATK